MKSLNKYVSLILPVRNEENFIESTLSSLCNQDYPKAFFELIVIDGLSEDNTLKKIKSFSSKFNFIKILNNNKKTTPYSLNKGIINSNGEIIIRVDSHSIYPKNYVKTLVKNLLSLNADCVGCKLETIPFNKKQKSISIANSLSNIFGVGDSRMRINSSETEIVDVVPFGCFKKSVFDKIGYFDIDLRKNQDDEFFFRMKQNGMKIYLIQHLKIKYYARKNFSELFSMMYYYGFYKALVLKKRMAFSSLRQIIPLLFIIYLLSFPFMFFSFLYIYLYLFVLIIYLFLNLFFSFKTSINPVVIFLTMISNTIQHISYGLGYFIGILYFFLLKL